MHQDGPQKWQSCSILEKKDKCNSLITLQHADIVINVYQDHYTSMNPSNLVESVFLSGKPGLSSISQKSKCCKTCWT